MKASKEKQCEEMERFLDDDEVIYDGGSKFLQKSVRLIALVDIAAALILMVGSMYFCATAENPTTVKEKRVTAYDDDFWMIPDFEISGTQMIMGAIIASQMTQMIFALCLLTGANHRMRDNCEPWVGLQSLILILTLLILVFVGGLLVEMPIVMIVLIMSCFYKSLCILIVGKFIGQLEKSCPESKKLLDSDDEYGMNDFII